MKRIQGAVAIDLGATSGRFAAGRLLDGRIEFEMIEQIAHQPIDTGGRLEWDIDLLLALCHRAADYAGSHFDKATIGIDTWGVDHGFIDREGKLIQRPVAYRDPSHARVFERLEALRPRLYELTGIQHQPFNTFYQVIARREEDPSLPERGQMLMLPDLLGFLLTGERHYELTQCSTSQLMGLDGKWSAEAFAEAGWPMPSVQPKPPGLMEPRPIGDVHLAHVGSHDTASAVAGFGRLAEDQLFLNVGTWSLLGAVIDKPLVNQATGVANLTNERTVEGRVRLLENIPGFYVINRLHEELGIALSVPEWLASGVVETEERIDLLSQRMFNPVSMMEACASMIKCAPDSAEEWAGLALASLTATTADQARKLSEVTGRSLKTIRVGGGGSQSPVFCQSLADASGLAIEAGPTESTVLGNLAMQFLASGAIANIDELYEVVRASAQVKCFVPRGTG